MNQNNIHFELFFLILFVSLLGSNIGLIAYADDSAKNNVDEKIDETKQEREEKIKELKEQREEKIAETKQQKEELVDDYKIKLEEKKKQFIIYEKELKEKFNILKKEFREKYQQLSISNLMLKTDASTTETKSLSDDEKLEFEIKLKELKLLEYEFREKIKNLKLEAKEQFKELKNELKIQDDDRKNKIRDRINELKEKYKDKIKEHTTHDSDLLKEYHDEYEGKKINVCHFTSENPDDAHTINISINALKSHMAHGDSIGKCDESEQNDNIEEQEDEEGKNIKIELEETIGISQQ
ncbi:MAG TPA: hypothetical protein VD731_03680 [Nitrosopumilaceae archaeon]|nr:hypothetical protein [Nitrosopumilaceae archaeon]